jgi:DNA-binding PadR family transcriptional regulator
MSIKYAVLGLLHYKDMHGYQIKDHIENNFGYMWTVNYGQIYNTLKALVDEGLITLANVVPSSSGAPHKKLYSITDKGKQDFRTWLTNSPERQMLLRDPFLMRFIFFGFGDKGDALRIIDEQIQFYEQQFIHRKRNLPRWDKQGMYVRMIAELGLNFNEMFLRWLYRVRGEIRESADKDLHMGAGALF